MLTKEYLQKNGYKRDLTSPFFVEDYFREEEGKGYISVSFKEDKAVGLYAYSQNEHNDIRRVVLSDTIVTEDGFCNAIKICRL